MKDSFIKSHSILNDSRIRYIKNEHNKGLIKSSNMAIALSSADYIMRLDSDDWIEKDSMLHLYSHILKYDLDIVYPEYIQIDRWDNINIIKHNKKSYELNGPLGAGCLIKTRFIKSIGFYDSDFSCLDGYYLYKLAKKNNARLGFMDYPTYYYYRHPNSLTSDKELFRKTKLRIDSKYK